MKKSNLLLLCIGLGVLILLTVTQATLYARYSSGTIVNGSTIPISDRQWTLSSIPKHIIFRNVPSIRVNAADSGVIYYDTVIHYTRHGDTLIFTGMGIDAPRLDVFLFKGPDITVEGAKSFTIGPAHFDSLSIKAVRSQVILSQELTAHDLRLSLTDSSTVKGFCHADTLRLQADPSSTIILSGSNVKMLRTKQAILNP
jgi:hypothetical protein